MVENNKDLVGDRSQELIETTQILCHESGQDFHGSLLLKGIVPSSDKYWDGTLLWQHEQHHVVIFKGYLLPEHSKIAQNMP